MAETATPSTSGGALDSFFARGVDLPGLARWLDGLDDGARAAATRRMTGRQQASLFEAAKGFRPVTLEHFVPAGVAPLAPVIHAGKNSLPMFSAFDKPFCRPASVRDQLWGYNQNPGLIQPVTGPGYFVCYAIDPFELLIDYTQVPPSDPSALPRGWPPVMPNSAGFSRFIYGGAKDTMRGVSAHVSIGRVARGRRPTDNWFVLCRRDAPRSS
jgi:hypothetical protein